MQIQSRHGRREVDLELKSLQQGLEYSIPAHDLNPDQLYDATNFYYDISTGRLTTRPGLVRLTNNPAPEALNGVHITTVQGVKKILVSSSTKIYEYSGNALTAIDNVSSNTGKARPIMDSFLENVYIASGGILQKYDGVSITDVTDSPNCKIVKAKSGRLYVDDIDDGGDIVRTCGFMNDEKWAYPDGLYFQAGWRDGDTIQGILPLANDLIVAKGNRHKAIIGIQGFYPNQITGELGHGTGIMGPKAMAVVGRNMLLLDSDGLNSVKGVIEYGDLKIDPMGSPVASPLSRMVDETAFILRYPDLKMMLCFPNDYNSTAYVLHYVARRDIPPYRWTRFSFDVPLISGGDYDVETDTLYLVSKNGHVYTMKREVATTIYRDDDNHFIQRLRTKIFDPDGTQLLLKQANIAIEPIKGGDTEYNDVTGWVIGKWLAFTHDGQRAINLLKGNANFYLRPYYGIDWDTPASEAESGGSGGMPETAKIVRSEKRVRSGNIQLGLEITEGAVSISRLSTRASVVGRE